MSQQLNEMDVYMKKHLEQQRKKKIIRWVCLILAVILLWIFRTDLLALILPTDAPPYWSRSTVWAAIQLPVQNEKIEKLRFYTEGKSGNVMASCCMKEDVQQEDFWEVYEELSEMMSSESFLQEVCGKRARKEMAKTGAEETKNRLSVNIYSQTDSAENINEYAEYLVQRREDDFLVKLMQEFPSRDQILQREQVFSKGKVL